MASLDIEPRAEHGIHPDDMDSFCPEMLILHRGAEIRAAVSVIVPCYQCSDTIERAVESIMAQTLLPAEIWLIEDGTDDGGATLKKLHDLQLKYGSKTRFELVALGVNRGPSAARNAGWDSASQPYLAFLDADDAWHPQKLEVQFRWMTDHPEVAITGHQWLVVQEGTEFPPVPIRWKSWRVSRVRKLLSNRFSTPTVMLKRDLAYRFDETDWLGQDFDLWMKIVLDGHLGWRLEVALAHIFKRPFGDGGLSKDVWGMTRAEIKIYIRRLAEGRINVIVFTILIPWLAAKIGRRFAIITARTLHAKFLGSVTLTDN
jgi:teichuronic acid biosynthesis glycosyltransferase TuaG